MGGAAYIESTLLLQPTRPYKIVPVVSILSGTTQRAKLGSPVEEGNWQTLLSPESLSALKVSGCVVEYRTLLGLTEWADYLPWKTISDVTVFRTLVLNSGLH